MVKLSLIAIPLAVVVATMSAPADPTQQAQLSRLAEPGTMLAWGTALAGLASVVGRHRK
jgi:hypothetical protein